MHDLNEDEQWEAIKAWWKENGKLVITIVAIVAALTIGFRVWQSSKTESTQRASIIYDQMISTLLTPNATEDAITAMAKELQDSHASTPYASNAALLEAKIAVESQDYSLAEEKLNWVIKHAKDNAISELARLRLARIQLQNKQPEAALKTVSKVDGSIYSPAIALIKGDIYMAQKNNVAARKSYQNALNALPESQPVRQYIQMQIDQLSEPT